MTKVLLCLYQKYSYTKAINLKKYGTLYPPEYNIRNIVTRQYWYYSENDNLATPIVSIDMHATIHKTEQGTFKLGLNEMFFDQKQ